MCMCIRSICYESGRLNNLSINLDECETFETVIRTARDRLSVEENTTEVNISKNVLS